MAITKAQSKAIILDMKAELDAFDTQLPAAQNTADAADAALKTLKEKRRPMLDGLRAMIDRHKRLFNEDVLV
jgi:hypothetical protein